MFNKGEMVIWLHEEKRGWGGTRRDHATFIRQTAKRVIIDVEYKDGHHEQKSVKPERIQPMNEKEIISALQVSADEPSPLVDRVAGLYEARIKALEDDRDNQKRIGDCYGDCIDDIQELVGRFQDDTLASVKELVSDYEKAQGQIKQLRDEYTTMRNELHDLAMLEGTTDAGEKRQRQDILNKYEFI